MTFLPYLFKWCVKFNHWAVIATYNSDLTNWVHCAIFHFLIGKGGGKAILRGSGPKGAGEESCQDSKVFTNNVI